MGPAASVNNKSFPTSEPTTTHLVRTFLLRLLLRLPHSHSQHHNSHFLLRAFSFIFQGSCRTNRMQWKINRSSNFLHRKLQNHQQQRKKPKPCPLRSSRSVTSRPPRPSTISGNGWSRSVFHCSIPIVRLQFFFRSLLFSYQLLKLNPFLCVCSFWLREISR